MASNNSTEHIGVTCEICSVYVPNDASWQAHVNGRKHTKNLTKQEEWKKAALSSVYVSGIKALPVAELSIADYFSKFGSVKKITIDKTSKQYAIVELENEAAVQSALESKRHVIDGCSVTVKSREIKSLSAHLQTKRLKQNEKQQVLSEELLERLNAVDSVDNQMMLLQESVELTEDDVHLRALLCKLIQTALDEVFPGCEVEQFGSSISGLGVSGCDLDLNLRYHEVHREALKEILSCTTKEGASSEDDSCVSPSDVLSAASEVIKQCVPDCHRIKLILSARSPLVRFYHKSSKMRCDMSMSNNIAVRNTAYLAMCSRLFLPFRPLVFVIRLWMKHWDLAGGLQSNGPRLNNYAVTLMILFYLQHSSLMPTLKALRSSMDKSEFVFINDCDCSYPSNITDHIVNSHPPLPQLLSDFFVFYSKLEFTRVILDLSTAAILSPSELPTSDGKGANQNPSSVSGEEGTRLRFKMAAMNIRDPFELHHNVAGNVNDKQLKTLVKCVRNAALACKMQRYNTKRKLKSRDWGILNLFIDHHCKDPHSGADSESESSFQIDIPPPADRGSAWTHTMAGILLTVLRDVFLVSISSDSPPASTASFVQEPTSSNFDDSTLSDRSNDADVSSCSEHDFSVGRKRKASASESCNYCKRAKLMMTSLDRWSQSSLQLPFATTCHVTHRLWEGRRKARRRLVQKGKSDFLELERQVSRMILSEPTSGTPVTSNSFNTSCSSCDSVEPIIFQFDLSLTCDENNRLCSLFQPSFASTEFVNFFRHLKVFLPNFISKCANNDVIE